MLYSIIITPIFSEDYYWVVKWLRNNDYEFESYGYWSIAVDYWGYYPNFEAETIDDILWWYDMPVRIRVEEYEYEYFDYYF